MLDQPFDDRGESLAEPLRNDTAPRHVCQQEARRLRFAYTVAANNRSGAKAATPTGPSSESIAAASRPTA